MVQSDRYQTLPTSDELPDSDGLPVDNEDQNLLPNYLLFLLQLIWPGRYDWYFAVDMGIYHLTGINPRVPVVPDGFLSLGIPRRKSGNRSRKSYVTWEEDGVVPILALEVVSQTPGGEYDTKRTIYENLGVLYYVIYNPEHWQRDRHQPFEVYKLTEGQYQLQLGEPYWMPEVGLGIGRHHGELGGFEQELLSWFDQSGSRYLSAAEQALQAQEQASQAQAELQAERQTRLTAVYRLQQMGLTAAQIAEALGLPIEVVNQSLK
ncbi:Uma2 family endonuclease [Halomicronema sp. CCY15110]|uniref:Uma2 family endonuclease n=1 Tax=Halomicronema sp. CCY15110 TaxID=2767773 RepID=UPI00195090D7|nr:Uma2 family endonuclease [Halomicronema sp. CCY15110]